MRRYLHTAVHDYEEKEYFLQATDLCIKEGEDIVEYKRAKFLVVRMRDKTGPYILVPGRLVGYKRNKNEFGIPVSTVEEVTDSELQKELSDLVKAAFGREPAFWPEETN